MGNILSFRTEGRGGPRHEHRARKDGCEIVIFPGVRIERHDDDLDLSHRLLDAAGRGDFDGLDGNNRPRKTS